MSPDDDEPGDPGATVSTQAADVHFLLVDHNFINLKVLGKMCEKYGQPVETAENGVEAVESYIREPGRFRCVVMNVHMPVMDGYEATRQIRAFEEAHNLRRAAIVGVTASSRNPASECSRYGEAGFDIIIRTPIEIYLVGELLCGPPETNIVVQYGSLTEEEKVICTARHKNLPGHRSLRMRTGRAIRDLREQRALGQRQL